MAIRGTGIIIDFAVLMALVCAITSCGGTGDSTTNSASSPIVTPPAVRISINPPSATVGTTQGKQFTATVSGSTNTAVSWSVNGTPGGDQTFGTISNTGFYTAPRIVPSPSHFSITANSQAAPSASATADLTIVSSIALGLSPQELVVINGKTQEFTLVVSSPIDTDVAWKVNGIPGGDATVGTMVTTAKLSGLILGLYTAPKIPPASEPLSITAISTVDPTSTATARVTILRDNQVAQSFPIKLGTSGGNASDFLISGNMIACCSGTLGSLVSRGGNFYILSNNHVLDRSDQGTIGDPIAQPGLADVNCLPKNTGTIAHLSQAAPLRGGQSNVDAALAQIVPGTVDTTGTILDLAAPDQPAAPSATLADAKTVLSSNEMVAKVGRSSGLTCSTVTSVNTDLTINYESSCGSSTSFQVAYTNQIVIGNASFGSPGDSGALVVTADTARPLGLLFAGSTSGVAVNPIQDVLSALKDPSTGEFPQIVGGRDRAVACPSSTQAQSPGSGPLALTSELDVKAVERAAMARTEHQAEFAQDPAVSQIATGSSEDDPSEPALILHLNGITQRPIPHEVGGVRTKIVFDTIHVAPTSVSAAEIVKTARVKAQRSAELMSRPEVFGVGIGSSKDSPGEAAIVIYVDRNSSIPLPAEIDGARTRVVRTDPFRTSGWGKERQRFCSKN